MRNPISPEADGLVCEMRFQLDRLNADLDKLKALAQALRLAAHGDATPGDGLYWPCLMATLEDMVPNCEPLRESIDRLLGTSLGQQAASQSPEKNGEVRGGTTRPL